MANSVVDPEAGTSEYEVTYSTASQIRIQNGHVAGLPHYKQLLSESLKRDLYSETSAATWIAATDDAMKLLGDIGYPYLEGDDSKPKMQQISVDGDDIQQLNELLARSHYRHSTIRQYIFDLPISPNVDKSTNNEVNVNDKYSLEHRRYDYPMGPTYIQPLAAGQGFDLRKVIGSVNNGNLNCDCDNSTNSTWLPSLQCLTALFLLASCIPKSIFLRHVIGGRDTLNLLLRLGVVYIFDITRELNEDFLWNGSFEGETEWIVPLVHFFPLEIPPLPLTIDNNCTCGTKVKDRRHLVFMTDLHPKVLQMTSIPKPTTSSSKGDDEGAVMYIGPDSLALVHHLHASLAGYVQSASYKTPKAPMKILDFCTGSGVQALSLMAMFDLLKRQSEENSEANGTTDCPNAMAVVLDVNDRALRFTTFNALLNGFSRYSEVANDRKGTIAPIKADLLSGKVISGDVPELSIVDALLEYLRLSDQSSTYGGQGKFDIVLANPPFIPVPPDVSDAPALSLREGKESKASNSSPRYGLFSSGGASGEDCLQAIVEMAPMLLDAEKGMLAVVSEFMNPPPPKQYNPLSTLNGGDSLLEKFGNWWNSSKDAAAADSSAFGILFTNEFPLSSETYAERRAVPYDQNDLKTWREHLVRWGIHSVSPGLLFVKCQNGQDLMEEKNRSTIHLKHFCVPKSIQGSIWTPHNYLAVSFTRKMLRQNIFGYPSHISQSIVVDNETHLSSK